MVKLVHAIDMVKYNTNLISGKYGDLMVKFLGEREVKQMQTHTMWPDFTMC